MIGGAAEGLSAGVSDINLSLIIGDGVLSFYDRGDKCEGVAGVDIICFEVIESGVVDGGGDVIFFSSDAVVDGIEDSDAIWW